MIGRLRGMLLEKQPPEIILDVSGVGYEVMLPMTCFYELPEIGAEISLFTHFVVREDAQLLYGFLQFQERFLFRELIKLNGVGPKLALGILSGMNVSEFLLAIEHNEISRLTNLPGVGKKTAERLIVEMKDRLKRFDEHYFEKNQISVQTKSIQKNNSSIEQEAIAALIALGYKPQNASQLVAKVFHSDASSEELIKNALKLAL